MVMNGPITTHPYYDKSNAVGAPDLGVPRVRPDAQDIYQKGKVGTVGMLFTLEGQRPAGFRKTQPAPKDHMGANVRRMRQIQRESKKKEAVKEEPGPKPVKGLWKSTKYEGVESKVRSKLEQTPRTPRPHSANYLRAHSRTGFIPSPRRAESVEPPEDKLSIPAADTARELQLKRNDVDWVKVNGKMSKKAPMRRAPSLTALDDLKKKFDEEEKNYKRGQVPRYLQSRKQEWAQAEQDRINSIPDPDLPEGHKLMPEADRRATLQKLRATEADLTGQLQRLPPRTDTYRIRTQKEELEKKIAEVEEAIRIFGRPKVFVKLDS